MKILISILFLFLTSCGLDIEGNDTQEQDLEQRQKLNQEYTPAVGTYLGEVTNPSKRLATRTNEIKIFITEEVKGTDNYGKPRVFPTLKAYWRLFRDDGQESIGCMLSAQYIEESSSIVLTTDNSTKANTCTFSMNGTIIDGVLEGDIYLARGYYGRFKGYLQEGEVLENVLMNKSFLPRNDETYKGKIYNTNFFNDRSIKLTLFNMYRINELNETDNSSKIEILNVGYFQILNKDGQETIGCEMIVNKSEEKYFLKSKYSAGTKGYCDILIKGSISNSTFNGRIYGARGYLGRFDGILQNLK